MKQTIANRVFLPFVGLLVAGVLLVPSESSASSPNTLRNDGSGHALEVSHDPRLGISNRYTVEVWVKPETLSGTQALVVKGSSSFVLMLTSGRPGLYEGTRLTEVPAALPVGEWSHIAATFDGVTRRIYVDGILRVSRADSVPAELNSENLTFGGAVGFWPLRGSLAEARMWSVARSELEIRQDINRQLSEPRDGLISVWPLDGSGQDITGEFNAIDVSGTFDGGAAPVVPYGPLVIPRTSSVPNVDGVCNDAGYGWLRFPIYEGTGAGAKVNWVRVVSGSTDVYFCADRFLREGGTPLPAFALFLDVDGDAGRIPKESDYRIAIDETGGETSLKGTGSGAYVEAGLTGFQFDTKTDTSLEFYWAAEMRFNRSLLPSSEAVFGFQVMLQNVDVPRGWPVDHNANRPDRWVSATISPSVDIEIDAVPPRIDARIRPDRSPWSRGERITFEAQGWDDGGVQSITHFVDAQATEQCVFEARPTSSPTCSYATDRLSPGRHFYWARVTDKGGRVTFSDVRTVQVDVDGVPPTVTVEMNPWRPAAGELVTIEATANDEANIPLVDIYYGGGYHRCRYTTTGRERVCRVQFVARSDRDWIRYYAAAWDEEGYEGRSSVRFALFDVPQGTDSDADGIPDSLERQLCTSESLLDTDRDGLADGWEVLGLGFDDGSTVDLPALGSAACQRDVFLQYDYEQGARVQANVLEPIFASYRRAGVTLHVEEHERPRIPDNLSAQVGALVAAQQKDDAGNYWFDPKRNWTHYYAWGRLAPGRSGAWGRYFTHDALFDGWLRNAETSEYERDDDGNIPPGMCMCPSDLDGATCTDSFPARTPCIRESPAGVSRRFMHETGHVLGLGHGGRTMASTTPTVEGRNFYYGGGWDGPNNKPNYISVMNYLYNGGIACFLPATEERDAMLVSEVDYSSTIYVELDESDLDERSTSAFSRQIRRTTCASAEEGAVPVAFFTCQDPDDEDVFYFNVTDGERLLAQRSTLSWWTFEALPSHAPGIDWNCDGNIEASVATNINGDGGDFTLPGELCDDEDNNDDGRTDEGCSSTANETMAGHSDWDRIPNRGTCNILYNANADLMCYPQNSAYRGAADGVDCHDGEADTCESSRMFFEGPPMRLDEPSSASFETIPSEVCNGHDDDADREVDEGCVDGDGDTIADGYDNCPQTANTLQEDRDKDGLGDACAWPASVASLRVDALTSEGLTLTWDAQPDRRGYTVYRTSGDGARPSYLGGEVFPSTAQPSWLDATVAEQGDGTFRYLVHAVNWNGLEGPDSYVDVTIANGEVVESKVGSESGEAPMTEEVDPAYSPTEPGGDAGVTADGAVDGSTDEPAAGDDGCGCRTRSPESPTLPYAVGVGLVLAWLRRRRKGASRA